MQRRRGAALVALASTVVAASVVTSVLLGIALWLAHPNPASRVAAKPVAAEATVPVDNSVVPEPRSGAPDAPLVLNKAEVNASELAVGDCIAVGADNAVEKVPCGAGMNSWRVSAQAARHEQCPSDIDRFVARPLPDGDQDTLCLDVDWTVGACMDMSGDNPKTADCAGGGADRIRVVDIKQGTSDSDACAAGERGVVYAQRHFVVCIGRP